MPLSNDDVNNSSQTPSNPHSAASIDLSVFIPAFVLSLIAIFYLIFNKDAAAILSGEMIAYVTATWGWLFDLSCFGAFAFCIWLSFGRYGHVKLGTADEKPEFSNASWVAMMFSAGIGIGLVNWAFVEPIYYLGTPPFDIEPHTSSAAEWGHMYALFHWSFVPWSLYALTSVPIAYVLYVKRTPFMRMSEACRPILKGQTNGLGGSVVNTLVILGMVGGASTSLGLGVPLVSAFTANFFGVEDSLMLRMGVLAFWTAIFSFSVYKGLKAGIRILSDINIFLAIIIIAFILVVGPTVFTLSLTANSLGMMVDNFVRMSFWLDPIDHGGFPNAWTLFYWAWWVAYAPTMGMFFGRISKGRTIRELVLGVVLWGSLGCISFIAICGGYAIDLELSGTLNVSQLLETEGIPQTVVNIVNTLPFNGIVSFLFTVLCFVFLATTLDSAAYVLASVSTKNLKGTEEPAKYTRLTWAFVLAFVAVGLIYVDGLAIVQSATIVTALPLLPILYLIAFSLMKSLKQDFGDQVKPEILMLEDKPKP